MHTRYPNIENTCNAKRIQKGQPMFKQVILASQSPRRRELLSQLDLDYVICPAVGEEFSDATQPFEYVQDLAAAKAEEIAGNLMVEGQKWLDKLAGDTSAKTPDNDQSNTSESDAENAQDDFAAWSTSHPTLIIGADTIVARGTEILGKPADEADAIRMLRMLQGATHQVYTGVALFVVQDGRIISQKKFYEKTDVTFGPVEQQEIEDYVKSGDPMDKAGAYGIQSGAAKFIKKIDGDYNNVVGLPIARLYQEMKTLDCENSTPLSRNVAASTNSTKTTSSDITTAPSQPRTTLTEGQLNAYKTATTETLSPETLERIQKQFDFILELDKEKLIGRQTYLSGKVRKENDAEHAWHMAIMAILLSEYSNVEIDVLHAVTMILLHDVVEIDAGDTFAYDSVGKAEQAERERIAADRIFALLPEDQAKKFRAYFDEFEAWETPEAKFAHAMDNFQPLMLNHANHGGSWIEHGIALSQVLGRNARSSEGSEELWKYAYQEFIKPSVEDGALKKDL
jgi:MAF protein